MATITVDQQKLVLNAFAAVFQNNLLAADLVTWKQYDTEMDDRNGLNVSEQIGPRYVVTSTTNGVADLSAGVQDSVFGSEQFKVNKTFGASMGWGDFVKILDIGAARESEALTNAATNLAEQIDAYILKTVVLESNNWTGTVGNSVASYDAFVSGYTRLKEEGVEDSDLRAVMTYGDMQALGTYITGLTAPDALVTNVVRKGFDGAIAGIPTMFTQQLPILTVGTRAATGAAQISGGAQQSDYKSVAVSGAPGQYMTQTIAVKNMTAGHTVKDGEVFTIANVNAWDNRAQASLGRVQQFRVVGDATADGSGNIAALRIFPAFIVQGQGSTASDINVNTAHAVIDSIPANSAAITWLGTASAAIRPRAIIQKSACIVNTAPLIMPATGKAMRKTLTKVPLAIRMWQNSTFATGEHNVRFDVAVTANVRERRRVCRINGA